MNIFLTVISPSLSNAYKFTHKGNVLVQVKMNSNEQSFLRRPSDTSYFNNSETSTLHNEDLSIQKDYVSLLISVKDSGIGIEKDKLGSLFQSFSQVDASTTRNFGGTGN
jgi:signal transduction histidine kinase